MDDEEIRRVNVFNQPINLLKMIDIYQRVLDTCAGDNFTISTVHTLAAKSQETFDAKHTTHTKDDIEKHYDRPIKLLRLNKNKASAFRKSFLIDNLECNGKCPRQVLHMLWHECSSKPCSDCESLKEYFKAKEILLFVEEVRLYRKDLFGAFFYHNLIKSIYAENKLFPALLIFFQVFNPTANILSITRHSIEKLKDLTTSCIFEDIPLRIEKNLNKKDHLLEGTSRDLFGLPLYQGTNEFDLIFKYGRYSDIQKILHSKVKSKSTNGGRFCARFQQVDGSSQGCGRILLERKHGGLGTHGTSEKVWIRSHHGSRGEKIIDAFKRHSKYRCYYRNDKSVELIPFLKKGAWTFSEETLNINDLRNESNVIVSKPPHGVHLKRLNYKSKYIEKLQTKINVFHFKRLILANETQRQFKETMIPEFGEALSSCSQGFHLNCLFCKQKIQYKSRRKEWTCFKCKNTYKSCLKTSKNKNKLKNFLNENILVTNENGYWAVLPSPIRYANSPRMMLDAVERYFKHLKLMGTSHYKTDFSTNQLVGLKMEMGVKNMFWNLYPRDVPILYGSSIDQLKGGKGNIFRKKISTKKCDNSCRLTATVDPQLNGDEISIPMGVFNSIGKPQFVMMIRYPSTKRYNLTFHKVRCHTPFQKHLVSTVRVSPTICTGHNLDFDGDALSIFGLSTEAAYELMILISPQFNVYGDGRMRLEFSRDAKIGLGFCFDGVTPLHLKIVENLCNRYFAFGGAGLINEEFHTYEKKGLEDSLVAMSNQSKDIIMEYINLKCGKMNLAHFQAMFSTNQPSLEKGLDRKIFIEQCIDARKSLLDQPANASDDGVVFSATLHILPDCILKYDYTLRTQYGKIISIYPFYMHPHYGFNKLNFPIETQNLESSFSPLGNRLKLKKISLCTKNLHFVFKNIIESDLIRVYEIKGLQASKVYGTLIFNDMMKSMGLKEYVPYLIALHVWDDYYCKYLCVFKNFVEPKP